MRTSSVGTGDRWLPLFIAAALSLFGGIAPAADLGDVLLKKGLITPEELKQAREEDKQKSGAAESKVDALIGKIPKWLDSISLFGDLRNRVEGFYGDNYHAQTRYRVRARVGLNANVSNEVSATVRFASGDANDPISTNQTLSNTVTRKPLNLDWAYMTIKPGKTVGLAPVWGQILIGKFPVVLARESELIWDDDLSPEGLTETLNLVEQRAGFVRSFRLNALQCELNEVATNNDSYILGAQAALDTAIDSSATWSASFADYSFQGMNRVASTFISQFSDPAGTTANPNFNSSLANSNDVVTNGKRIVGYRYGFNVINFGSELDFPNPVGLGIPVGVYGDLAHNTQADKHNTGVILGAGVGSSGRDWYHNRLRDVGDWAVTYSWLWVEKDALVSLFSYSDFNYQQVNATQNVTQKGSTNVTGSVVRFDYELFSTFQLTLKSAFINALDRSIATTNNGNSSKPLIGNPTLVRLQFDAQLRF
jgi:hypothetical protein